MIEQVITMVLRDGTSSGIIECALDSIIFYNSYNLYLFSSQ
jgi:hypothetical protein